ncbi:MULTISPECIES: DUF4232 domain-containing protein [Streptomyces]|uniref:DUF4232 domain-containing protein n=1 Tax=Streptomyces microflavus TaxID=1919 RepID=A0A7H8MMH0_STRMI|nr:DUF4232 domain-containing protein [Streptomyces microflavus]QKW43460.1 DUF4232 domain-containing protein [Streptomyces microflavus]WSR91817.1 DUF4232 domain-containing protein [Streptomyces microflavus]
MRTSRIAVTAAAVVAGLSLSACGGDDSPVNAGSASSSSSSTPAEGQTESAPAEQPEGGAGSPDEEAPDQGSAGQGSAGTGTKPERCHTDDLTITASDATIGGDETKTVAVTLLNKSGRECSIKGFAGVNLLSSEGAIPAARRDQKDDGTVLKSGEPTYFGIFYKANESGGSGVRIKGLVVTPPDEKKSVTLKWPGEPSLPVTDSPDPSVEIGPMGSVGQGQG